MLRGNGNLIGIARETNRAVSLSIGGCTTMGSTSQIVINAQARMKSDLVRQQAIGEGKNQTETALPRWLLVPSRKLGQLFGMSNPDSTRARGELNRMKCTEQDGLVKVRPGQLMK